MPNTAKTTEISGAAAIFILAGSCLLSAAIGAGLAIAVVLTHLEQPKQTQSRQQESTISPKQFQDFQIQLAEKMQANDKDNHQRFDDLTTMIKALQPITPPSTEPLEARLNQNEYNITLLQQVVTKLMHMVQKQEQKTNPLPASTSQTAQPTNPTLQIIPDNTPYVIIDQPLQSHDAPMPNGDDE